jgi:hypothetical protein
VRDASSALHVQTSFDNLLQGSGVVGPAGSAPPRGASGGESGPPRDDKKRTGKTPDNESMGPPPDDASGENGGFSNTLWGVGV